MFDVFQLEMTTESIGDGGHLDPAGVGGVKGSNGVGGDGMRVQTRAWESSMDT